MLDDGGLGNFLLPQMQHQHRASLDSVAALSQSNALWMKVKCAQDASVLDLKGSFIILEEW